MGAGLLCFDRRQDLRVGGGGGKGEWQGRDGRQTSGGGILTGSYNYKADASASPTVSKPTTPTQMPGMSGTGDRS